MLQRPGWQEWDWVTLADLARAGCSPCTRCHRDLIQGTFPSQGFLLNLGGLGGFLPITCLVPLP